MTRHACVVVMAAAMAVVIGACGEATVDTSTAEREIRRDIAAATGARVRAVRCPREVEAKKGDVFRCRAILSDRSRLPVRVTQIDNEGGVRWQFPTLE